MTPIEKRAHAEVLMTLARSLLAEADAEDAKGVARSDVDGNPRLLRCAPAARVLKVSDRIVDTTQARRIANRESSTLYRWARQHGVGWKTGSDRVP